MTTKRKVSGRKTARKKTTLDITKAKARRIAKNAQGFLDSAGHDAKLAFRRTARKLETTIEEAKGPANRRARKIKRDVVAVLENAGASISSAVRRAKSRLP